jgi:ferredoxin
MELLSPRTDAENGKLKGLGEDWRLACQCLVGGDTAPEGAVLKVVNKPKK